MQQSRTSWSSDAQNIILVHLECPFPNRNRDFRFSNFPIPDFRLAAVQIPAFRFPTPDSYFRLSNFRDSRFSDSRLPIPTQISDALIFSIPDFRFSRFPMVITYCRFPIPDSPIFLIPDATRRRIPRRLCLRRSPSPQRNVFEVYCYVVGTWVGGFLQSAFGIPASEAY